MLIKFVFLVSLGIASSPLVTWGQAPKDAMSPQKKTSSNLLIEAVRSVGATQCLAVIERLSTLAIAGSKTHEILLDWDRINPNTGPVFSLLGVGFSDSVTATSITTVPQAGGACAVAAERISMAPYTCKSIAQLELKGYKVTPLLPMFTVYTSPQDIGASVSLMESPPGCLIIRRHVQYGWQVPVTPSTRGQ